MRKYDLTWGQIAGVTLGILVIAAANFGDNLLLNRYQVWIFQRMMQWVGLGLVVVFTVGERLSDWALEAIEKLDVWILRVRNRTGSLLTAIVFAYIVFWCGASFIRHYYFNSSYDLAVFDQIIWNTSQGRLYSSILDVTNPLLADHVQPHLALLGLIYLVVPSPYILLAFQSSVLALSAWPLYRLSQRKFNSPTIGLVIAFCVLAYPPLGFINRFDFHGEVIVVPLLIAAYERIDGDDLKSAALFLGLALLGKENVGLSVAAMGLIVALYHRLWRFGLTWTVVGLVYFLAALFVVIPVFRGAPAGPLARYHWLAETPSEMLWTAVSQPVLVLKRLIVAEHFLTLLQLLAPLAFLPLLSLTILIPAMPTLVYNFMAEWPAQETIYYQYMALVVPFVCIAAVLGLHWLATSDWANRLLQSTFSNRLRPNQILALGVSIMLLATVASWTYENPVTSRAALSSVTVERVVQKGKTGWIASPGPIFQPNDAAIREGLRHVPNAIHVRTTSHYLPHLSHRPKIRSIPRAPVPSVEPTLEAIFLSLKDLRARSCDDYFQNLQAAARAGFGVTFYRDGVLLVEKGKGDLDELNNLLARWTGCH
jgi:uncharacterized membrane protein